MIGNDSCGVHSVRWGRTADNVERLTALTYDGLQLELGPTPRLDRLTGEIGRRGDIYRALVALRDRYGRLIEQRFPKIPRLVSGFENLDALLTGRDFNVARAVTGTEGTCVIVLEAELNLVPRPKCKAIALLSFDDVYAAADAVPALLEQRPDAIEGFDGKLYDAVRETGAGHGGLKAFPEGRGFLIVEAGGDCRDEAEANVRRIVEKADTGARSRIVSDPVEQRRIWEAREASLGATAFVRGQPEHWPGWEDSAVPPDKLGAYLRDLEKLFAEHGYTAALYGHFGDGVTHCRVNFDFHSDRGLANYRRFMREAAKLVHSYGGSLSGEHGDGQARAELLKIMYGDELVQCFREFKAIWDPDNRLNPGKAIDPFPIDFNLRLGLTYEPRKLETFFEYPDDHNSFAHATTRCVGVGKCRRRQVGEEVMCPSYLVTGEEKHCTRGRAHLLHEMIAARSLPTAGTARRSKMPSRFASRARVARRIVRSASTSRPGRPSFGRTIMQVGRDQGPLTRWRGSTAGRAPRLMRPPSPTSSRKRRWRNGLRGFTARRICRNSHRRRSAAGSVSAAIAEWEASASCSGRTRSTTISGRER